MLHLRKYSAYQGHSQDLPKGGGKVGKIILFSPMRGEGESLKSGLLSQIGEQVSSLELVEKGLQPCIQLKSIAVPDFCFN